jgi:serine/threonine protein phosphatase PrpC
MITVAGATHTGIREHNEDAMVVDEALGFGLVADGMGGYACGEVASEIVKSTLYEAVANQEGLVEAIARAHASIREAVQEDKSKTGMGSTVVAIKFSGSDYEIAWVGDSRAYLWDGELKQISRDHSYVESLLSSGAISIDEAMDHPNKNLITQAVGAAANDGLEIGLVQGRLGAGQQILLCSDGLVDEVKDADIAHLLNVPQPMEQTLEQLVSAALEGGGRDNITVVLMSNDSDAVDEQAQVPYVVQTTRLDGSYERHDQLVTDSGQLANRPRQLFGSSIYPAVKVETTPEKAGLEQLLVTHKQNLLIGVGVLVLAVALLYTFG